MKRDDDFNDFEFEDDEVYEKPIKKRIYEDYDDLADTEPPFDEGTEAGRPKPKRRPSEEYMETARAKISEKKSSEQKYQYRVFLLLTICVGFVVFILTMMMILRVWNKGEPNNAEPQAETSTAPASEAPTESAGPTGAGQEIVDGAMVIEMGIPNIKFYQMSSSNILELKVTNLTEIRSKSGNFMGASEISIGDVVDLEYDGESGDIISLGISPESWEQESATNVTVDYSENSIRVGNKVYGYTNQIISVNKGEPYDIGRVTAADTLSLKGYQSNVVYIELIKGHGSITIENKAGIINGILEIDSTGIFINLSEAKDTYDVPEGIHNIKVTGDNINDFTQQVNVGEGANELVDLGTVEQKNARLTITANVPDVGVFISSDVGGSADGAYYSIDEPIELPLGSYIIKVEKEGYHPVERRVILSSLSQTENFELKESVKVSKVYITSQPEGADVYIDNQYIGLTPVETDIVYGYHTIIISKDGYTTVNSPLDVKAEETPVNVGLLYDYTVPQEDGGDDGDSGFFED
ncbi:MAG: PEGA domain-containing protein [Clostridiales bacterium]|jgi:hypothetical protein|nr:PEGA domain-containing protein [Clostridiales bacterium]